MRLSVIGKLFAACAAGLLVAGGVSHAAPRELRSRTFRFTYRVVVKDIPPHTRTLEVWLPYPRTDHNQSIHRVKVNAPGAVVIGKEPEHGNQALYFRAENPSDTVALELEITATRREYAGKTDTLSAEERRRYLRAEPLVPLDGPVKALAAEAVVGKRGARAKARAIYEKVTTLLKYDKSGTGWGRGDALYACDVKRGNCTDFHALIIGMARSQGIPARFAIGFPLPPRASSGQIPGYHCWAELFVDGRWLPVDSSEGAKALVNRDVSKKDYFFGHHDEHRIQLSRGRNLTLEPPQKTGPLNYFVYPHVEVDGRPHQAMETRFLAADIARPHASASGRNPSPLSPEASRGNMEAVD